MGLAALGRGIGMAERRRTLMAYVDFGGAAKRPCTRGGQAGRWALAVSTCRVASSRP